MRDAAGSVVYHVERVARGTARMIHGGVKRREVVPGSLDLGTGLHGIADAAEDVLDLFLDLVDEMRVTDGGARARQRHVDGLGGHEVRHGLALQVALGALDEPFGQAAQLVRALAQDRALFGRNLAHHMHDLRNLALLAQEGDAHRLELLGGIGRGDKLFRPCLQCVEIFDQTHVLPFPLPRQAPARPAIVASHVPKNEKPPLGRTQGRYRYRGTTLIGCRMSARHAHFCPLSFGRTASLLSCACCRKTRLIRGRSSRCSGVNAASLPPQEGFQPVTLPL